MVVDVEPFAPIAGDVGARVDARARELAEFLGGALELRFGRG